MTGKCTSHIYGYSAFFYGFVQGVWVFCCCVVCFLLVFVLSHPQGDLSRRIEFIVSREFYSSQDYGLRPCPKAETSHPKIKAHYIHIYRGLFCFSIHFNTITEGFFFTITVFCLFCCLMALGLKLRAKASFLSLSTSPVSVFLLYS